MLTHAELDMLRDAIDSHIYWQLSDRQYRNNADVRAPGSDDPEVCEQIAAFRALEAKIELLLASLAVTPSVEP